MAGVPGSLSSIVGNLGGVRNAINSQSPAQNPATPQIRLDTQRVGLLDVTRIIESIKRALQNEGDEQMQQFYQLFLGLMESRKAGTAPVQLLQELAQSVHVEAPPPTGVPGMGGPMMPQPPQSAGGMMGAQQVSPQPGPTGGP